MAVDHRPLILYMSFTSRETTPEGEEARPELWDSIKSLLVSGLFTSAAFTLVAVLFGFQSGLNPGPQPGNAARFLLTVFPPVLMRVSLVCSCFLNFEPARAATPDVEASPARG